MSQKRKQTEYFEYLNGGIRVLLPSFTKIKHEAPNLYGYGVGRARKTRILIQRDLTPGQQEGWESLLHGPVLGSISTEQILIREGDVQLPYRGFERVIENRQKEGPDPNTDFMWGLVLYPTESSFLQVQISSFCEFAEEEHIWKKTVESIFVFDK